MGAATARVMGDTAKDQYHSPPRDVRRRYYHKNTLKTTVTITVVKAEFAKS